jgi:hypothetical protein
LIDPAFESLNFSIPTPQFAKKEKTSIYSTLSSTPIKRCSRKIISVRPTLNARIRSTYVSPSDKTVMMSVELENDTENDVTFSIEHLDVGIAHGIVTEITGYTQDTSNVSCIAHVIIQQMCNGDTKRKFYNFFRTSLNQSRYDHLTK